MIDIDPWEVAAAPPPPPAPEPTGLSACRACTCRPEARQVLVGAGPVDARILVLGSNPSDDEDEQGAPFVGYVGRELDKWLGLLGIDRRRVAHGHAVKCHTTANRPPTAKELKTCATLWLGPELIQYPELQIVLPLGKPAITALLGKAGPPLTPLMAHHYLIRVDGRQLHVFPMPHPGFFVRSRHMVAMFQETVLTHVRLTLQQECAVAYAWSART